MREGTREVEGAQEGRRPWGGNLSGLSNICTPDRVRLRLAALAAIAIPPPHVSKQCHFRFLGDIGSGIPEIILDTNNLHRLGTYLCSWELLSKPLLSLLVRFVAGLIGDSTTAIVPWAKTLFAIGDLAGEGNGGLVVGARPSRTFSLPVEATALS